MTKRRLASYGLNLVGVALLYALITLAFTFNAFGKSTTYIQGICTTACYTIIMVTSLNLVVGFMGEFSMGHAGFVSVGAYVSAIVSGALAGHGLSDLALLLVAILAGGLAAGRREITTDRLDWLYHNTACRAAVKAGNRGTPAERQRLAEEVLWDDSVRTCPHGRPVCFVLTRREIEKQFGRVK